MASLLTLMHFHCEEQRGLMAGLAHPIQVISTPKLMKGTPRVLSGETSQMNLVCCWTDGKTRPLLAPSSWTP